MSVHHLHRAHYAKLAKRARNDNRTRMWGDLYVKAVVWLGIPALTWFGVWQFFIR